MDKGRNASVRSEEARSYRCAFAVELARGASHIASTLSPATRESAVADVMDDFAGIHGEDMLPIFCKLLAESLRGRQDTQGALAVQHFLKLRKVALV